MPSRMFGRVDFGKSWRLSLCLCTGLSKCTPLVCKPLQARQLEMARLQQLADVLGMGPAETAAVQDHLSEQAFRAQVRGCGLPALPLVPA